MAATMASSFFQPLLRPELRQPPSTSFSFRPIRTDSATRSTKSGFCHRHFTKYTIGSSTASLLFSFAPQTAASHSLALQEEDDDEEFEGDVVDESEEESGYEIDDDDDDEDEEEGEGEGERLAVMEEKETKKRSVAAKLPGLTVKEKKELASYAHGLGKKLKSQLVGKSGVTENVATSFIETLEANELLKIKIHGTCPGELDDVVQQLQKLTGAIVVSKIGRTVIIYRPSISKLKAEEKRRQERKMFVRQQNKPRFKPAVQVEREPRTNGRGRRGSSRSL
ncbi:Probable RNA-binding protein YqeI [Linum grandiflorum]